MSTVDPNRFRAVMGAVCAPVTIVTTISADGGPRGATVSSFTSLSLEPPLVGVAFDRRSALLADILAAGRFGVNLLGHGQDDLAVRFATRGADRFTADTTWFTDAGLPRLADATGWVACALERTVDAGDHLLLFGLVTGLSGTEQPPLVYARRTFGTHSRFTERPRPPITDQIAACAR
ncbi:flavin reductase family protein [Amycolatopsis sp. lyj-23]|uniref:flavin reductase family protein n=1 Tax=Amycolatopsis sp. lyj-23 TaxID=2789283 RepID=UPI00397D8DD2